MREAYHAPRDKIKNILGGQACLSFLRMFQEK